VDRANASATCPISAAGVVTVPGQCVLRVAAHGSQIRQLRLRAQSPVTVTAPVPRCDITVQKSLDAGTEVTVAVDAGGADIGLACDGVTACAVTLVGGR